MNNTNLDKNYEDLANGIICQAVHDYRCLLGGSPPSNEVNIDEIERFFTSGWYDLLTQVDGATLMNRIRREFS